VISEAKGERAAAQTAPKPVSEPVNDFTELYEQHFDFIWRSVRMLGIAPDVADDVVQDVFLVAHRRLGDFEARAAPRTWLFAIAMRVVSAHRRSQRRRMRLFARAATVVRDAVRTPFDDHAGAELSESVLGALAALPEEQRLVFALTELEDMTAPEVAAALGMNLNTVYSRLRLARRTLAARMRPKSEAEQP
jgi:RNA polymerase sigma-70 factor (ECF subfamily)